MAILQLIVEKEKSLCFDFLEEKIREESRKLIESIYADKILNWSEQEKKMELREQGGNILI